ncbi:hypothetical protein MIR68_011643 [Amoeboaphelidium protococcarum]|nr:hypothetical protein MIR68_011643 [Amoeboaphelidium protococcarum]
MLIRNLNIDAGLVNGTMLKVLTLNRNSIKCQIINGSRKDDTVSIPKIGIVGSEFENVEFVRHQFQSGQPLQPLSIRLKVKLQQSVVSTYSNGYLHMDSYMLHFPELDLLKILQFAAIMNNRLQKFGMFPTSSDVPSYFQIDLNVLQHSGLKR